MGDLFDILTTSSFNTDKLVDGEKYDYVTRTSLNQGVLKKTGFINKENINEKGVWSLGLLQMDFFYRKKSWYAGQFVRKIVPKLEIKNGAILFFSTILNMQKSRLLSVLVRDVDETFLNTSIQLPTKDGKIDFDFMDDYISELEEERISELAAYLKISGLDNYKLLEDEKQVIKNFSNIKWKDYQIGNLFEKVKTKKLSYKAKNLPKEPVKDYILPVLTSSFMNQGLNYYIPRNGATVIKNVISIPSNSDVYRAYYQSREFTVLSDAYAVEWKNKEEKFESNEYLFTVSCINKVTDLAIYSYKNKLGGWNVVKNKYIKLPVNSSGEIDFEYMKTFIQAVKKLIIKDVVLYKNKKIDLMKDIIKQK